MRENHCICQVFPLTKIGFVIGQHEVKTEHMCEGQCEYGYVIGPILHSRVAQSKSRK